MAHRVLVEGGRVKTCGQGGSQVLVRPRKLLCKLLSLFRHELCVRCMCVFVCWGGRIGEGPLGPLTSVVFCEGKIHFPVLLPLPVFLRTQFRCVQHSTHGRGGEEPCLFMSHSLFQRTSSYSTVNSPLVPSISLTTPEEKE